MKQETEKFTITCKKCGSTDVFIKDDSFHGSEETGPCIDINLYCRQCGESEDIS